MGTTHMTLTTVTEITNTVQNIDLQIVLHSSRREKRAQQKRAHQVGQVAHQMVWFVTRRRFSYSYVML